MRPITLTMSAFGSYAKETTIDFKNANHGIFLVAGDTGSGKTTIFDAICFALYDRTSGGQRDGSDMRSQYADSDTPTFVDFTFSYGEEIYRVKRNPKYTRVSKRKDKDGNEKTTTEQPSVELTLPDGHIFKGKVKETNEKLVEIIGLDADQFTQIAMIAQGEFMRLLQAPSNKRKEIFSRIFQTKVYWQIQEALKSKAKAEYILLEDNRKFIEQELKNVKGTEEPILFQETKAQEIMDTISSLVMEGKQQEKEIKAVQNENQKSWEQKTAVLAAGMEINKALGQLEKVIEESKILEEEEQEVKNQGLLLEKAQKALVVAIEEEQQKKEEQVLLELGKKKELIHTQLDEYTKKTEELQTKKVQALEKRQKEEPGLQEELTRSKDSLPLYEEAKKNKEVLLAQEKQVQALTKEVSKEKETLEELQTQLVKQHQLVTQKLAAYQSANDSFIAEQAGIMASTLVEGMPCPVCGATSHPQKAKMSEQAMTQQEVTDLKNEWFAADQKEAQYNQKIVSARTKFEKTVSMCHEQEVALENIRQQQKNSEAQLKYQTIEEALQEIKRLEKEILLLQEQSQKAEKLWLESKEKVTMLSGEEKAVAEQEKTQIKSVEAAKKNYEKTLTSQGFDTKEAYFAAKLTKKEMDVIEKQIADHHDKVVRNEEAKKQLTDQTKGKEKVDVQLLNEEIKLLEAKRKELDKSYKEIYTTNQRNQEAKEKITDLFEQRKLLVQRYTLYSNLDKTANGSLAGAAKLDFQTYMQRRYFEKMIHEANKRLMRMTSNQFILQCRDLKRLGTQGAVGLDLDVYSIVNDKIRDVKTLSGGESFMAALSMALGMADVIQNTAGKVKLDTMFVDEGFGSLDDESRQEAMRILTELAGDSRLVGIISHVTELKEQIDKKLIVQKTDKGSKVFWAEE